MSSPRVRVYIACSWDGFIAGPGDDLSWLPGATASASPSADAGSSGARRKPERGVIEFEDFLSDVGALLMGRRTYDVVEGFGGSWPYGPRPVLVATHRRLEPGHDHVRAASGSIEELVERARGAAGGKDVYLDGGVLIRQALDAQLVDELIVSVVPVLLGQGHALFAGVTKRHTFEFTGHYSYGPGMLQLHARPRRI